MKRRIWLIVLFALSWLLAPATYFLTLLGVNFGEGIRLLLLGIGLGSTFLSLLASLTMFYFRNKNPENRDLLIHAVFLALSAFFSLDLKILVSAIWPDQDYVFFDYWGCSFFFLSAILIEAINKKRVPFLAIAATIAFYLLAILLPDIFKIFALVPAALFYALLIAVLLREEYPNAYRAYLFSILPVLLINVLNLARVLPIAPLGIYSFMLLYPSMLLVSETFSVFYLHERNAALSRAAQSQALKSKQEAYDAQSGPHFIFNSLTYVQGQYHESLETGDEALRILDENLSSFISFSGKNLIPFEEEAQFIERYVELANLRASSNISLNIEGCENLNIKVPPLSICVYVENALAHGDLDKNPNGNIHIRAQRKSDSTVIDVLDNGQGFDPDKPIPSGRKGHTGMQNSEYRLAYLLDAKVEIVSKKGVGTRVRVTIPKGR